MTFRATNKNQKLSSEKIKKSIILFRKNIYKLYKLKKAKVVIIVLELKLTYENKPNIEEREKMY